jgi:outer membrane receptor protein involved in Fe transport
MVIMADKVGTYYLPSINLINLRAQKEFAIKDTQRLQLMLNIFNLTDAETVIGVFQTTGGFFRKPRTRISGTVVRFGARYTF